MKLAKARLEARRARKAKGQELPENEVVIPESESQDAKKLEEFVLQEIEAKHRQEREHLQQVGWHK